MPKTLAWILVAALLSLACTDESAARRTLDAEGFTDVRFTGYAFFSCGKDDTTATEFVATNPRGRRVKGAVCCGLVFKGCTVRF